MKKYNHLYALAFSVDTDRDAEARVVSYEILPAIYKRIADVTNNGEWDEAIGPPLETVENQPDTDIGIHTRCAEADYREAFASIKEDIDAFNTECEAEEYTDTGDAWTLLGDIHTLCKAQLEGSERGSPSVGDTSLSR